MSEIEIVLGLYIFISVSVGLSEWANNSTLFILMFAMIFWPLIWVANFHATLQGK